MPGLAIIISPESKDTNERNLRRMLEVMHHEPFYTSQTFSDESLGCYVGWMGHAGYIHSHTPLRSTDGKRILFFYGEHHSDSLESSNGNTAANLLNLFESRGVDALSILNGWFHGILIDIQKKEILIFNDRYGMQRLYVHDEGETSIFASEAKSLLAIRPELRKIDPKGLAEFLTCGCVLEHRTLFEGVRAMSPATARIYRKGQPKAEKRYFTAQEWESQSPLTESEFNSELKQTLLRAVQRCVTSNPSQIGLSLTGGFDTRLIMACLNQTRSTLPCYTFGGMYRDCFDVKIGRKVSRIAGCKHQVLELDPSFLKSFPQLAEKTVYISDGALGATNAYELYLNRLARNVAPIRLTGSFGSEVMRGARAFKAVPPTPGLIHRDLQQHIEESINTFDHFGEGHGVSFSVFKHAPWYYYNRLVIEQSQLVVRTPFMDNDFVGLFYRKPESFTDGRQLARRMMDIISPVLASLPTDTGNCSYLRQQWIQFLFKADYCYKSGMPQSLEKLHYLLGPFQPEKFIVGTHRFAHFRIWFRRQLADYVREILLDSRTLGRSFFNKRHLETMVHHHIKGDRNYTEDIERAITIELACRLFLDN